MADNPLNIPGGMDGAGEEENVDQYFDDGGETFLPADHVSRFWLLLNESVTALFFSRSWPDSKMRWPSNWRMNTNV